MKAKKITPNGWANNEGWHCAIDIVLEDDSLDRADYDVPQANSKREAETMGMGLLRRARPELFSD